MAVVSNLGIIRHEKEKSIRQLPESRIDVTVNELASFFKPGYRPV
jgi:hypothetical protein